ncbi:unnamed protein product [Anisakis simplex]|uniref:Putative transcription factor ap-2 gamma (inferred by orthology to a S. mansoni protein) n=1 Tax=Anisakis simplex TaxID=6269 RepID=A0A0M3JVG0_ANISI|nr:unnamed protein product [Anisakis simplex]
MTSYFQHPGMDPSFYRQYATSQQHPFLTGTTQEMCFTFPSSANQSEQDSGFQSDLSSLNITSQSSSSTSMLDSFTGSSNAIFGPAGAIGIGVSAESPLLFTTSSAPVSSKMFKVELPPDVSPQQEFCKTPSRTALLTSKQLSVSIGEIHRRIYGPEMLNISILGAYLRKAKEKSGGKALRDELKQYGMNLPSGRRKNGVATTWTCFVEEETQQMAIDLDDTTRRHFPVRNCAQTLLKRLSSIDDPHNLLLMIDNTRRILGELSQIFREDKSPIHGREMSTPTLDKPLQHGFYNFSCVTHGFGMPAYIAATNVIQSVLDALAQENAMLLGQVSAIFIQ